MARIFFGLLLVVAALSQATILPRINPLTITPDVVLVLLFLWCAAHGLRESLAWVFFTGLFLDVLASDWFGTNALALMPIVLLAILARQRVFQANVLVPAVLVAIATVVHGIVLLLLRGTLPSGLHIPIQAGMHALIISAIYLILRIVRRS